MRPSSGQVGFNLVSKRKSKKKTDEPVVVKVEEGGEAAEGTPVVEGSLVAPEVDEWEGAAAEGAEAASGADTNKSTCSSGAEDTCDTSEADEAAAKAAEEERKKAAAAAAAAGAGGGGDDEDEKLDAREIKKMKPPQLKEHLKARGLSTQGAKKDLIARLLEACK